MSLELAYQAEVDKIKEKLTRASELMRQAGLRYNEAKDLVLEARQLCWSDSVEYDRNREEALEDFFDQAVSEVEDAMETAGWSSSGLLC